MSNERGMQDRKTEENNVGDEKYVQLFSQKKKKGTLS